MSVYTNTLTSGYTLTTDLTISFGEAMIAGLLLALACLLLANFILRRVYGSH